MKVQETVKPNVCVTCGRPPECPCFEKVHDMRSTCLYNYYEAILRDDATTAPPSSRVNTLEPQQRATRSTLQSRVVKNNVEELIPPSRIYKVTCPRCLKIYEDLISGKTTTRKICDHCRLKAQGRKLESDKVKKLDGQKEDKRRIPRQEQNEDRRQILRLRHRSSSDNIDLQLLRATLAKRLKTKEMYRSGDNLLDPKKNVDFKISHEIVEIYQSSTFRPVSNVTISDTKLSKNEVQSEGSKLKPHHDSEKEKFQISNKHLSEPTLLTMGREESLTEYQNLMQSTVKKITGYDIEKGMVYYFPKVERLELKRHVSTSELIRDTREKLATKLDEERKRLEEEESKRLEKLSKEREAEEKRRLERVEKDKEKNKLTDKSKANEHKESQEPKISKESKEPKEKTEPEEPKEPKKPKEKKEPKEPKEKTEPKEPKESKEPKEKKEPKEPKERIETKEKKEPKEPKESKEPKEKKEPKEPKESIETKEKKEPKEPKEKRDSKELKEPKEKKEPKNAKESKEAKEKEKKDMEQKKKSDTNEKKGKDISELDKLNKKADMDGQKVNELSEIEKLRKSEAMQRPRDEDRANKMAALLATLHDINKNERVKVKPTKREAPFKSHKKPGKRPKTPHKLQEPKSEGSLNSFNARKVEIEDIVIGENICKYKPPDIPQDPNMPGSEDDAPMVFKTKHIEEQLDGSATAVKAFKKVSDDKKFSKDGREGVISYSLSDRSFIEKGWTVLPVEKVVRKMNIYRMRPAQPEFDWFEHNKKKIMMSYDTGERLAEFDDKGRCRWYYKNGRLALDYYDAEEANAQQRFVVYSNGEPDERGRSRPVTVLASFDYLGNGVVFDHSGKIRLKYNQTDGIVLDRGIGPVSHWKWHTLNDPPVLQQVMIDTQMSHKDPIIWNLGGPGDFKNRPDNEEMLAIEFDNFIKEKSKKMSQSFKPFQIKMKALKINENFSLKVLDQATVYLIFRDGTTNLKQNIGMVLDPQEIVDTDTAELGIVSNNLERLPARTQSISALQASITNAQHYEKARTERERRLRPQVSCVSVDRLTAAQSRPMRRVLQTLPTAPPASMASVGGCGCGRKSLNNLYYDNRLV